MGGLVAFAESSSPNDSCSSRAQTTTLLSGNAAAVQALRRLIIYPTLYAEENKILGTRPRGGLLLHGPPGSGKVSLVHAVVQECGACLTLIRADSLHGASGEESEKLLQDAFSQAYTHASNGRLSVILIRRIDSICSRSGRREQISDAYAKLLMLIDKYQSMLPQLPRVAIVATANRLYEIGSALRRSGRLDSDVEVKAPSEEERMQILGHYIKDLNLDPTVDLKALATSCNGYVASDLKNLCREAFLSAKRRSSCVPCKGDVPIVMDDWKHARSVVSPTSGNGVISESKVSWDDIGGLSDVKKRIQKAVEWPIKYETEFAWLQIKRSRGILLYGPPGCSKTSLAIAAAHLTGATFFSLSGADMYSMYVGEGEALVRSVFVKARLAAPSIIFFDEVDNVARRRGGEDSEGNAVGERLLSTLLTEMDGLEEAKGIFVMAATNQPYAIDTALLRPGRFDPVLYVPPPDVDGREEILKVHTRRMKLGDNVNLRSLAEDTDLFTGAELANLCSEAGMVALREGSSVQAVFDCHFQAARKYLTPSLTPSNLEIYESFMKNPSSASRNVWKIDQLVCVFLCIVLSILLIAVDKVYL